MKNMTVEEYLNSIRTPEEKHMRDTPKLLAENLSLLD